MPAPARSKLAESRAITTLACTCIVQRRAALRQFSELREVPIAE
jgi:hypothetical protein